jgi:mercuric ion binding protein
MKATRFIFTALLAVVLSVSACAKAHDHSKMTATKTETIEVSGNCEMCKVRIEKAAKIDGVSKADWNEKSKVLTLVYNPSKVKSDDVQKRIAAVGHDTSKFKASDAAYNALPECCKYRKEHPHLE